MVGLPAPWILALGLALIAIAAVPTRRLWLAGFRPAGLLTYLAVLVALGFVVADGRGPSRLLVPVLVGLYAAPFVVPPNVVARLVRRTPPPAERDDPGSGSA